MHARWLTAALCCAVSFATFAADGLLRKQSPHSVATTVERFEAAVRAKGLKVFPRVDHAAAAREFGLDMPDAVVVAFGNPRYGTPFMLDNPQAAIDFPPRALVYADADGRVWLAYNSATYLYESLFARHGLDYPAGDVQGFAKALDALTDSAVGRDPIAGD